jgi:UDP-N-acetylglucosamine:LPS N-acetylglucosamine transferase
MPVHPKFEQPDERTAQAARCALGLDPDKFTVFVNAGWVGGGNIPEIFRELVRGDLDVQAIFLAGKNEELRAEAESVAAGAKFPVKVIGYSEQVEQLMHAASVMVSKLGGLTTYEAFASRVPIIADATTPPMPQESGAAALVEKRGAGVMLERAADIVPVVRRLATDARLFAQMRAATAAVAIPNSTRRIVEEIAALIPAPAEEEAAAEQVA